MTTSPVPTFLPDNTDKISNSPVSSSLVEIVQEVSFVFIFFQVEDYQIELQTF